MFNLNRGSADRHYIFLQDEKLLMARNIFAHGNGPTHNR